MILNTGEGAQEAAPSFVFSVLDQSALLKVVMSVMAFFFEFLKKEQTLESFRFEFSVN